MGDERNRNLKGGALVIPALLLVCVFLLAPLTLVLRLSLDLADPSKLVKGVFAFDNYVKVFTDPFYLGVLGYTAKIAGLCAVVCVALGFPVAYFISRAPSERLRGVLIVLVVLPLLLGNAVRSAAWMVVLSTKGVVNTLLLGSGLFSEAVPMMYTPGAVMVALVSVLLPFAIITLQSVMDSIPQSLEEAGRSLGYSPLRTALAIVLPLALPGVIASAAICFILAMNAYATPVLIGGPSFHMMAPLVYQQIAKVSDWPFGSALASILMAVTMILTLLSTMFLRRKYF